MELNAMISKLKNSLSSEKFTHSLNVMKETVELAEHYQVDRDLAVVAGLLHDCAKCIPNEEMLRLCSEFNILTDEITSRHPELLHGPVGAAIAKRDYGVTDDRILQSIEVHTTGTINMTMLQKIVFIADLIEPDRSYKGVEKIREKVLVDLDDALILAIDSTICFTVKKGVLIHPDTIKTRNYIMITKYPYRQ